MLYAQEQWIDATRGCANGESDVYETFTDDRGELYRAMQREYGRCVSKVYVDSGGGPRPVGWVFQKSARYTYTNEPYVLETWVTVHRRYPQRTIEYDYA